MCSVSKPPIPNQITLCNVLICIESFITKLVLTTLGPGMNFKKIHIYENNGKDFHQLESVDLYV